MVSGKQCQLRLKPYFPNLEREIQQEINKKD